MKEPLDISSEECRVYVYAGDKQYAINRPIKLYVTDRGSHRVVDYFGWTHRPEKGWVAIKWMPHPGHPAFVA